MWKDPIVEEVRKVRDEHGAKFKYDLNAIYQDLKKQPRLPGHRYVHFEPRRVPIKKAV